MKPSILLIEDDGDMRDLVAGHLEHGGFDVQRADDGIKGQALALQYSPDLILLDLMLPKVDGLTLCQRLRREERTAKIPILMITALGGTKDKVSGFNSGADDYLTKPFDLPELEARVRALLRRGADATTNLMHGRLCLDMAARRVYYDGQPVDLSAREFAVLQLLLMREGRVVSKEHMVNHLYGWGDEVGANAIEVYVHRIRKKLEPLGCEIRTVRGMGYLMEKADGGAA